MEGEGEGPMEVEKGVATTSEIQYAGATDADLEWLCNELEPIMGNRKPSHEQYKMMAALMPKLRKGDDAVLVGDSGVEPMVYLLLTLLFHRAFDENEISLLVLPDEATVHLARRIVFRYFSVKPKMWLWYQSTETAQMALFDRIAASIHHKAKRPYRTNGFVIITTMADVARDAAQAPFRIEDAHIHPMMSKLKEGPRSGLFEGKMSLRSIVVMPDTADDAEAFSVDGKIPESMFAAEHPNMRALAMLSLVALPFSMGFPRFWVALPEPSITVDILALLAIPRIHGELAAALGDTTDCVEDERYAHLMRSYGVTTLAEALTQCPSVTALRLYGGTAAVTYPSEPKAIPAVYGQAFLGKGKRPIYADAM